MERKNFCVSIMNKQYDGSAGRGLGGYDTVKTSPKSNRKIVPVETKTKLMY
jgi:hypothetical protein